MSNALQQLLEAGMLQRREEPSPEHIQLVKDLRFIRDGNNVKRFHTVNRIQEEKVGQHSGNLAWLAFLLSSRRPSMNLIMACLAHDLPEHETGDMPSPGKRAMGSVFRDEWNAHEDDLLTQHGLDFELTAEEKLILKLADVLDGLASCQQEHVMGNCMIDTALHNFTEYSRDFLDRPDVKGTEFGRIGEMLFTSMGGHYGH